MNILKNCTLCPRSCGTDRTKSIGFCGATNTIKSARAALHHWEEPCISGTKGSGTVFFSGCNLACCYCQNYNISTGCFGKEITLEHLSEIFLSLQEQGAHNINLVTPTPYIPQIKKANDLVRSKIHIPFVFNTGGYEKPETIYTLKDYADIFLTDVKYKSAELSQRYSKASDYFEHSISALGAMLELCGKPRLDPDGIMKSGVIVRHLVLPNCRRDSFEILKELKNRFGTNSFVLSLMSQYTPNGQLSDFPELNRRVTSFEYNSVVDEALRLGFDTAYVQEKSSAKEEYTPPFDLTGL
ncbi:MAG: radical SAM protein [Ruminococcaceae bacterium]|nr:radical SAM protein [Oscillospiraceae bacterium]